jgi:adenylosuccinate synthase
MARIGREIHGTRSTLVHVFAKAEKLLQRRGGEEREIRRIIEMISLEEEMIDEEMVFRVRSVLPLVTSMVNAGDIQLKNQEEITLFSDPDRICPALASLVHRRKEAESDLREKEEFIHSHPAVKRARQVEKVLKEIANDREKIKSEVVNIREAIGAMEKEIPARIHDLESALQDLFAGGVRLKV